MRGRLLALATRTGHVLVAWIVLIALENVIVGVAYRHLFAGFWEMGLARRYLSPLALAALLPLALALAALAPRVRGVADRPRRLRAFVISALVLGASAALSVSTGRHMQSWLARGAFMLAVGGASALAVRVALPRISRLGDGLLAGLGASVSAIFWSIDAFVLPRLYPGFHASALIVSLASASALSLAWQGRRWMDRLALAALAFALLCGALARNSARGVERADNLRLILLDHAPILGRAVRLASALAPPIPTDDVEPTAIAPGPGEVARALDWTGRDLVLLSIDALRADHVGAYGYDRHTTPNIDALAARGTRVSRVYCPTPHTSYSVTSLLTGKYMRPLLSLGVGDDSDTWAGLLRRYGFRTAAFYPPAVFFIDEQRFEAFRDSGLGFEYRKVEFAGQETRVAQVHRYIDSAPRDRPLFLWVHLFEPHEPYVVHEGHRFGASATDLDAYDSEIAEADETVGKLLALLEARRPGAVVIVTADHGEEFGEHGGRYHGTTVYEEQVRVPLIVVGPGVRTQVLDAPAQTIDLLPTALSALGIPRPARVRGRDLGPLLQRGEITAEDRAGFAFSETDDFTLVAEGSERLVCARKVGACTLFDVASDPLQRRDLSRDRGPRASELRRRASQVERDHGRYEGGVKLPDALRLGKQGEVDAAEDVAGLLDDASPAIRREAAEVCFSLHAPSTVPQMRRAMGREDDEVTRRFLELALVRSGEPPGPVALALVADADLAWRRRAALALAERGDARGTETLVAWWREGGLELDRARELLAAFGATSARSAVPALVRSLDDVRLRPLVADTLGRIGDLSARDPLLKAFAGERYRSTRPHLARALLALGAREEFHAPLARFAGVPEPMTEAVEIAARAGLLTARRGGVHPARPAPRLEGKVTVPAGKLRLLVLAAGEGEATAVVDGRSIAGRVEGSVTLVELGDELGATRAGEMRLELAHAAGVIAAWIVPRADEIPPPPPVAWDAGASSPDP